MALIFHQPVLLKEVVELLKLKPKDKVIDATIGGGGQAKAILPIIGRQGKLLGIDTDAEAIEFCRQELAAFKENVVLEKTNFANLKTKSNENRMVPVNAILFDLGVSLHQLKEANRGFSFMENGTLDMRFDQGNAETQSALAVINSQNAEELAQIFKEFGDERQGRYLAREIVRRRREQKFLTTADLAEFIARKKGSPKYGRQNRTNPATQIFQALRIYVNKELEVLPKALEQSLEILGNGGRMAVISYHSLEDRIVKRFFQTESKNCLCPKESPICTCGHKARLKIITKKPVIPTSEEIARNPRSRSAKLRIAQKL